MQNIVCARAALWPTTFALSLLAFLTTFDGTADAEPDVVATDLDAADVSDIPMVSLVRRIPSHSGDLPIAARGRPPRCDKDVDPADAAMVPTISAGVEVVALQDNIICTNTDIDVYGQKIDSLDRFFVVQGGGADTIFVLTEVTDPAQPKFVSIAFNGRGRSHSVVTDVKAFRHHDDRFVALALERAKVSGLCGILIFNVTDPSSPTPVELHVGNLPGTADDWCDTHNIFVESDSGGEATHIYATANATQDLRVLAISDSTSSSLLTEVGRYRRSVRGFDTVPNARGPMDPDGASDDIYVHDMTVAGGKVYVSYWAAGLDILDAALIKSCSGEPPSLADETHIAANVSPDNFTGGNPFLMHHAVPNDDGTQVFVQDEITFDADDEPVQMWKIAGTDCDSGALDAIDCKLDGIAIDWDIPAAPAHNLAINRNIDPDRLYVGWYKMGLQGWNFDDFGFTAAPSEDFTADVYHQAQVEPDDDPYSGAWGVRLAEIDPDGEDGLPSSIFAFVSDRNFGLLVYCLGDGAGNLSGCPVAP